MVIAFLSNILKKQNNQPNKQNKPAYPVFLWGLMNLG